MLFLDLLYNDLKLTCRDLLILALIPTSLAKENMAESN